MAHDATPLTRTPTLMQAS